MSWEDRVAAASESARDRDTEEFHSDLAYAKGSLARICGEETENLRDEFYRKSKTFHDWYSDSVSQHSQVSLEAVREMAEKIYDGEEDYNEFGRYMFVLMDSYMINASGGNAA